MDPIQAIILGVIEGLTEFLPISSTFHLILASKLLGIPQTDFVKLFEVFIQAGAIAAVALIYGKELLKDRELMKKIILSFFPTAIIGFLLYKIIKNIFFESSVLMIGMFIFVGLVFFLVEELVKRKKIRLNERLTSLTVGQALLVGLIQSLAVVPGVSRAGAVIVGLMMLGFRREDAAKYSFFLAVPTILAASIYDLYKMRSTLTGNIDSLVLLVVGSIAAFVTAYLVIRWFINYLRKKTLRAFAFYRFIIAIIVALALIA